MMRRWRGHGRVARVRGADRRAPARHCNPRPRPRNAREEVLTRLYADHAPRFLTFVLRLTGGDRQRAEDVVQETLLRAWRHADRLGDKEGRSPRPWWSTVARRIVIDEHRGSPQPPRRGSGPRPRPLGAEEDHADRVLQVA